MPDSARIVQSCAVFLA